MMGKKVVEGIVVKVTEDVVVLLCPDGTFKNVARPTHEAPQLGERYTYIEKKTSWAKYTTAAAIFLLVFISYLFLPFSQNASAYVVAIDINPSIELMVNDAMKVIDASANNVDGEKLLATVGTKGQSLSVAIKKIITYSEEAGFFLEEQVVTTSVIPIKEKENHVIEEMEQTIKNSVDNKKIDVVVLQNSKVTYEEAKKNHLSVNHYRFFKELEHEGVVKTIEEVKGKSIAELRKMKTGEKAIDNAETKNIEPKQNKSSRSDDVNSKQNKSDKLDDEDLKQNKSSKPDDVRHKQNKSDKHDGVESKQNKPSRLDGVSPRQNKSDKPDSSGSSNQEREKEKEKGTTLSQNKQGETQNNNQGMRNKQNQDKERSYRNPAKQKN